MAVPLIGDVGGAANGVDCVEGRHARGSQRNHTEAWTGKSTKTKEALVREKLTWSSVCCERGTAATWQSFSSSVKDSIKASVWLLGLLFSHFTNTQHTPTVPRHGAIGGSVTQFNF